MIKIISTILKVILKKVGSGQKKVKYKIGNVKHHNSRIDELVPELIEIGDNFVSAPGSIILSHDSSMLYKTGMIRAEKTIIGDNVFIGANAVVLPGVKIGSNVIVGAGSVVTKNIKDGLVIAGNPAKIICTIDEYIDKCKSRSVLYETPIAFKQYFINGKKLSEKDRDEFQNIVLKKEK